MRESDGQVFALPESRSTSRNEPLRKEQIRYYVAWHTAFGDLPNVVYNAMGPDISSILYFANPTQITGIDPAINFSQYSQEYIHTHWSYIDETPVSRAASLTRSFPPDERKKFHEDIGDRSRRGYWNLSALERWGIDRLFFIDLKKLHVEPRSISLCIEDKVATVRFLWGYPGERPTMRTLRYIQGTLDDMNKKEYAALRGINHVDGFFQKSIPAHYMTAEYLRLMRSRLNPHAVVAIGHRYNIQGSNEVYKTDIQKALGDKFSPRILDVAYEKMIDDLPEDDPNFEENKYGMKLHVFRCN